MSKTITYLLKDALEEIESLQEYYNSQKQFVKDHVDNNLYKYKYGIIIDRYFFRKVYDIEPEVEIEEKEQEIINEIIEDYKIKEGEEGIEVEYKLNSQKDFSKYEMNPQIAKSSFYKLIRQPNILNESMLMMLLVKYEEAISGIYWYLLESYPKAYLLDRSITYSELLSFNSPSLEEIKKRIIDKEIENYMRQSLGDWYKEFSEKHKIDFDIDNKLFESFKEIYYRRNIVVHNQGYVNEIYKKNVTDCDYEIGEKILIKNSYIEHAFVITMKILIGTVWGLRKTADDVDSLHSYMFDYGYECLKNKEWELAEYIYDILLRDKKQKDADILCEKVNLWIAIKNTNGIDTIEKDIQELDVSAMKNQFSLAKYALLDDYDNVLLYLDEMFPKEINAESIKEWPLLNQFRETSQYKTFVDSHAEFLEKNEYKSKDETVGDSTDILEEYGEEIVEKINEIREDDAIE